MHFADEGLEVRFPASAGPHGVGVLWDRDKPEERTTSVRVYKLDLTGKVLGVFGKAGKEAGEIGWTREKTCLSENRILLAELLNWRVQKADHPRGGSRSVDAAWAEL
jgi:hypothetical protein